MGWDLTMSPLECCGMLMGWEASALCLGFPSTFVPLHRLLWPCRCFGLQEEPIPLDKAQGRGMGWGRAWLFLQEEEGGRRPGVVCVMLVEEAWGLCVPKSHHGWGGARW